MTSLNIFFDWYGFQVQNHLDNQYKRLEAMITAIDKAGWTSNLDPSNLTNTTNPPDTKQTLDQVDLSKYDVLVLTSRVLVGKKAMPFSSKEVEAIVTFVQSGKGLWCMANHAGFDERDVTDNHVASNSVIASTFFTSYQAAAYQSTTLISPTLKGTVPVLLQKLGSHPIIQGIEGVPLVTVKSDGTTVEVDPSNTTPHPIQTIATRSFCGVYPNAFTTPIAYLTDINKEINSIPNPRVINHQTGNLIEKAIGTDPQAVWAVALDSTIGGSHRSPTGKGRVVIGGDAGWLGDVETTPNQPGKGQFQNSDNPQYLLNTLAWLSGKFD